MDIQQIWRDSLDLWGTVAQHPMLHAAIGLAALLLISLIVRRLARFLVLQGGRLLARQHALKWLDDLRHNKVFHRLAQTTPSLVLQFGLKLVPELSDTAQHFLGNVALAFTLLFMTMALSCLLDALLDIYARTEHARTRSIKGYVQLAKLMLWIFASIVIVATLIDRSPLERIKSQKHQKREPDPFDREETERILTYMHERYDEQVWNWYEFAFGTGMRPSEQIVVQWRDVDWKRQSIRVERARVRAVEKSTKTRTVRDVDLTPRMMAVLRRQKAHSFMRGLDSPIFINPVTNTPWPDVQDQRKLYFHPALRALGIRSRDAYQTRHTYATTALMGGVNPAYIARQLGHKSAAMLFRHYSKWIDHADYGREAAKLNQIYGS